MGLLLVEEDLQLQLLQQLREWLQQLQQLLTDGVSSWQLWPAAVAVFEMLCCAACGLPSEHVACRQLLPAWDLAKGLVVGSASAA